MLPLLPNDIIYQIIDKLDIEDIIYLYRVNSDNRKLFNNKDFIHRLSLSRINTCTNNFKDFLELYNQQHITFHSLKYFSLEECFKRSAASDIKYINFYKQLGANNYEDFFLYACEVGNIDTLELSIKFLRECYLFNKYTHGIVRRGMIISSKSGNLLIFKQLYDVLLDKVTFEYDFESILKNVIKYNNINILEWIINNINQYNDLLYLEYAIDYNNFIITDYLIETIGYDNQSIVEYCIKKGTLSMFKHLVIDGNRLSSIDDNLIHEMIINNRNDIIKYLHENNLFIFDQFHLDLILYHSYENNNEDLVKFAIYNGSKLYTTAVISGIDNKDYEMVDYVLGLDDVYTYGTSEDYIYKILFHDRNKNAMSNFNIVNSINNSLKSLFSIYSRPVTYNFLLLYGAVRGDRNLIDKAINNGANSYKKAMFEAYKHSNYEVLYYLKDKYLYG